MIPLAVMVGNILFTIWIVGGFVAILLLNREEAPAITQRGIRLTPPPDAAPESQSLDPIVADLRLDPHRDVYWERHPGWLADRTDRAA